MDAAKLLAQADAFASVGQAQKAQAGTLAPDQSACARAAETAILSTERYLNSWGKIKIVKC